MKYDYSFHKDLLTKEEVDILRSSVVSNLNSNLVDQAAPNVKKTSDVKLCLYGDIVEPFKKVHQFVIHANMHFFGLDLFEKAHTDGMLYNVYDESTQATYEWHKDSVNGESYDHKLSVLVNLSENPYQGGNLELFLTGGIWPMDFFSAPGSVVVFPSWYVHRVTPVLVGQRISLATFYSGPNLK
jgi:PKHD-type hydroxylase